MANIQLLGLNHKTAPIEVREKASLSGSRIDEALDVLKKYEAVQEHVILSTCNRTEIYAATAGQAQGLASLWDFIARTMGMPQDRLERYFYVLSDTGAVEHLFRVAASLDSMVIGETQVFGQVKDAYFKARRSRCVGRTLDAVFEEAIRIGKRVRAETQIGRGAVSTSTAAIELARKIFTTIEDKKVLIIGAGKIGEETVKNLFSRGAKTVIVANRTLQKARELAEQFAGRAIAFDDIERYLCTCDIVISSAGAPHCLIFRDQVRQVMHTRNHAPLFFIDLGLPRNIEPSVNGLENVYLYNIDDLANVKDANIKERLNEARKAEEMIRRCVESLCRESESARAQKAAVQ